LLTGTAKRLQGSNVPLTATFPDMEDFQAIGDDFCHFLFEPWLRTPFGVAHLRNTEQLPSNYAITVMPQSIRINLYPVMYKTV